MSIRDNQLALFDTAATPRQPKRGKRTILARKCWNDCNLSYGDDGEQTLIPATSETDDAVCEWCGGPMRLTAVHADSDLVGALLAKAERLQYQIRAQAKRRREIESTWKGVTWDQR